MSPSPANTRNWDPKRCSQVQLGGGDKKRKIKEQRKSISQPHSLAGRAASQLAVMRESHLSPIKGQTPLPASPRKPVLLGIKHKKGCTSILLPQGYNSCISFPPPAPMDRQKEQGASGRNRGRPPPGRPQIPRPFSIPQSSGKPKLFLFPPKSAVTHWQRPKQPGRLRAGGREPATRVGTRSTRGGSGGLRSWMGTSWCAPETGLGARSTRSFARSAGGSRGREG